MKKVLMILLFFAFLLSSCSFSNKPSSNISNNLSISLDVSEAVMKSEPPLPSAFAYQDEIKVETVGETKVYMPVLPTNELNNTLKTKIFDFVDELDLPYNPPVIDFYFDEGYSTKSYTFYLSDSSDLNTEYKMHFSYNAKTNSETQISDFFEDEDFSELLNKLYKVSDINIDAITANSNGITLYSNGVPYTIDGFHLENKDVISVFYPDRYFPVIDENEKYVAITFDDGPNPYTTDSLVDILDEKGIKATFFMVGYNIEEYRNSVKKVYKSGHDIGIHSYGHSDYSLMSGEEVISDLDKCANLVYSIIGKRPYLVRPPFGSIDMSKIDTEKYFFVNWNVDPLDWKLDSPEKIAEEAIKNVRSGSIILLHDIYATSRDAASIIIDELLKKGYRFVTLSEYFDLNGKKTDNKLHFYLEDYNANEN